jgi:Ca2+-binding RTX toxin-like protein
VGGGAREDSMRHFRSYQVQSSAVDSGNSNPVFDSGNFVAYVNNPFMILRPGTTFVYQDKGEASRDIFDVTHDTAIVDGVSCIVVHDSKTINGQLVEDTFDYFAQDRQGNVWYFGEDTKQFEPGNPDPIGTEGSWRAGVHGARPGIIMEADPKVGDAYFQENAPGIAEDAARVLSLDSSVRIDYGNFDHTLKTKETTALDPGNVEFKQYVAGVGEVLTTTADGEYEQLVQIVVRGLAGDDHLDGYAGDDVVLGRAGSDTLRGLAGNDKLSASIGNDALFGGLGNDTLVGGSGNDKLVGGLGADIFRFRVVDLNNGFKETDTIQDYHRSQVDVIDLLHGRHDIASDAFVDGIWELTLKGDGDVVKLAGVSDVNHNGHVFDDLLIV